MNFMTHSQRLAEINKLILSQQRGLQGNIDIAKLDGAIKRVDNAIAYQNLDDVFEIAAKIVASIIVSHACPDANKRTGLCAGLIFLSLSGYEIPAEHPMLADATRDLAIGTISEKDYADILYVLYHINVIL